MSIISHLFIITLLFLKSISAHDVCVERICTCESTSITCDSKKWQNLDSFDFPSTVSKLTLNDNSLRFDTISDQMKINNLPNLNDLSLNDNPIVTIPPFNNSKLKFFSLQNTLITSARIPSSYSNSYLQTISLKNNRIRTINDGDLSALENSSLSKLNLDGASISTISSNAFQPLKNLQSLSLKNNLLQTCKFLLNMRVLSSIHLDGNRFTSLPDELSMPGKIKTYSFRKNLISTIDESSPLNTWLRTNRTGIQIYLANNSFDCCASIWFIRLLQTSRQFIGDADLLTCVLPTDYAGKFMINLKPDEMNCDGHDPHHSWWSASRIIKFIAGGFLTIFVILFGIVLFYCFRNRPSRNGYIPIGDNDPEYPYRNMDPTISRGPAFPADNADDYDAISSSIYSHYSNSVPPSEAPTRRTAEGHDAIDDNHVETIGIDEEARLPSNP